MPSDREVMVPIQQNEPAAVEHIESQQLATKPPARYTEATLLSAMENAGKEIQEAELRDAMREKGIGTPATRAAIIEGAGSAKLYDPRGAANLFRQRKLSSS